MNDPRQPEDPKRRGFIKASAIALGSLTALIPVSAGLTVFLDPLRRKGAVGEPVRVTTLDALPNDGIPRKFSIISSRTDAWNKYAATPIGAIYLRRTGEKTVEALNVICPHAGCFVDYLSERKNFFCPCHNSSFTVEGKIDDPKSPSPRPLDTLEVEIRNDKEVWVKFQNYQAGRAEKIPVV